jgi:hypothetical protein
MEYSIDMEELDYDLESQILSNFKAIQDIKGD